MPVTPSGIISLPLQYLAELLAASAVFQVWTGAANETEALDSIHYVGRADPAALARPYAIASFAADSGTMNRQAGGVGSSFGISGGVGLILFNDVNAALSIEDQVLAFANKVGAILAEMAAAAGTGGRFDFTSATWAGPFLTNEDEAADEPDGIQIDLTFQYEGSPTQ